MTSEAPRSLYSLEICTSDHFCSVPYRQAASYRLAQFNKRMPQRVLLNRVHREGFHNLSVQLSLVQFRSQVQVSLPQEYITSVRQLSQ